MELVSFELLEAEAEKMPPGNLGPSTLREWNEPPAGGLSKVTEDANAVNSENVEVTVNQGGLERLREKVDSVNEELRRYY